MKHIAVLKVRLVDDAKDLAEERGLLAEQRVDFLSRPDVVLTLDGIRFGVLG